MLFNDVRPHLNSSVTLTTGGLSLMVGSLLLSLSALSVYRLNQTQDITINTASWNWMSEVQLRLDAGAEAMGPQLNEAVIPDNYVVAIEAPARPQVKPRTKWLAKAKSIVRRAKPPKHEPKAQAMIIVKKPKAKVQAQAEVKQQVASVEAPAQASSSELNILQGLHQNLRSHLMLAMTTQPDMDQVLIAQMGPQAVKPQVQVDVAPAAAPASLEVASESLIARHRVHKKKAHTSKVIHHESVEADYDSDVSDEAVVAQNDVKQDQTPAPASVSAVTTHDESVETKALTADTASVSQDLIQSTQSAPQAEAQMDLAADYSPQIEANTTPQDQKISQESTNKAGQSESGKILVASRSQTVWVAPSKVTTQGPAQPANSGVAAKPSHKDDSNLIAAVNTQRLQGVMRSSAPQESTDDYSTDSLTTHQAAPTTDATVLTEAFDWVSPVSGGAKSYLSKEAGSHNSAWLLAQASDHWPTLARRTVSGIPLISKNTSKLLSALAGATLEAEAGIVFGKVPSGWTVRLSGRSERPIFLNARNQTLSPSALDGERYFAFLNVAPGAHLVYLANRNGVEEGAVGIAAVGGVATYADFTSIRKVTLTGKVLDGSDAHTRTMAGATVRVLGALATHTETNRAGKFTIENVLTVGDYPVYVETDSTGGYTHRYQLSPSQLQNVVLYRLSPTAIQTWTTQLEGAISPDSGIVIAAVPGLASKASAKARLTPVVQSLASNPTLKPEVYTLSNSGQMQVGQSLDAQNSRFVSVQVPEGPAVAKVIDSEKPTDKNLIWSEIIMVSPAVINIVGPF